MQKESVNIIAELKRINGMENLYETEKSLEKDINSLKKAINRGDEELTNRLKEKIEQTISTVFTEEKNNMSVMDTNPGLKTLIEKRKNNYFEEANDEFVTAVINFQNNSTRVIEYESAKDNPKVCDLKHVEYQGILISEESMEEIKEKLKGMNIEIQNSEPDNPHITCKYFAPTDDKKALLFSERDIEKPISFKIIAYGEYIKEGKLANQGVLIDKSSLEIPLSDRTLSESIQTDKPHITLSVNKEKVEIVDSHQKVKKVPFSAAKDTVEATFNVPLELEATGTLVYFSHAGIHTKIEENERDKEIIKAGNDVALDSAEENSSKNERIKEITDLEA